MFVITSRKVRISQNTKPTCGLSNALTKDMRTQLIDGETFWQVSAMKPRPGTASAGIGCRAVSAKTHRHDARTRGVYDEEGIDEVREDVMIESQQNTPAATLIPSGTAPLAPYMTCAATPTRSSSFLLIKLFKY